MARVVFEPLGEEIECGPEETVLDAAFREGYALVYGCREGQCSACKCYLLEGEVSLKPYSTFALSETEESQGYTLLCRAMPDDDLVVELLHYDPDNYRLDVPIRDGVATVVAVEDLTHDISRLELKIAEPDDFTHRAGHYVDLHVPGEDGERRSFSMANLPGEGVIELMIKRYPGGRISGLLETGGIEVGQDLGFTGPYGAFYLRDTDRTILMIAGGSGMAPEVALLRELAKLGSDREIRFFYGARTRKDLCCEELIAELGSGLPNFEFIPVLSDATDEDAWEGETGFVHEAADRWLTANGADVDAYICGPPPMVDASIEMLTDQYQVEESQIFYDKFTTNAAADEASA